MGRVDFLARRVANHAPLTPITFLERASAVHPTRQAVVHGNVRRTWRDVADRVVSMAAGLRQRDIGPGSTVVAMLANTPEMLEAHHAVPLLGATLCSVNTRLDPAGVAFILRHSECNAFVWDSEFDATAGAALEMLTSDERAQIGTTVKVVDPEYAPLETFSQGVEAHVAYHELLASSEVGGAVWADFPGPADEWDSIALNYTSGTTGNPKGVLLHHRGAHLNALANIVVWSMAMEANPVYLWTLPMFHCNGWCFPWTIAAVAGTHVCLRHVTAANMYSAIADAGVTHMCGAPIVMQMLLNATADERRELGHRVKMMTAASPPPAAVLAEMKRQGFDITHVYGLTEVYGPAVVCDWQEAWADLDAVEQAAKVSRQGVRYPVLDGLMVADPATLEPVPADGETIGEIFMRGNIVCKGYLKNERATEEAFEGGWFHTGDLAVLHPDGYCQIADRSKDIIISGGENISSIEVQDVLFLHPAVADAAVVAKPDDKWGEVPCAFVELRRGVEATPEELDAFCRTKLAGFKRPKAYVFGPLPKTPTGKVQKMLLRDRARELGGGGAEAS